MIQNLKSCQDAFVSMIQLLETLHKHAPEKPIKGIASIPQGLPKKKIQSQLQDMKNLYEGIQSNPDDINLKTKYELKWPDMRANFFITLEKCLGQEFLDQDYLAKLKGFLPEDFKNLSLNFK